VIEAQRGGTLNRLYGFVRAAGKAVLPGCVLWILSCAGRVVVPLLAAGAVRGFFSDERAAFSLRLQRNAVAFCVVVGAALAERLLHFGGRLRALRASGFKREPAGWLSGLGGRAALVAEFLCALLVTVFLVATDWFAGSVLLLAALSWAFCLAEPGAAGGPPPPYEPLDPEKQIRRQLILGTAAVLSFSILFLVLAGRCVEGQLAAAELSACVLWSFYLFGTLKFLKNSGALELAGARPQRVSEPAEEPSLSPPSGPSWREEPKVPAKLFEGPGRIVVKQEDFLLRAENVSLAQPSGMEPVACLNFALPRGATATFRSEDPVKLDLVRDLLAGLRPPARGRLFVSPELCTEQGRFRTHILESTEGLPGATLLDVLRAGRPEASVSEVLQAAARTGVDLFLPFLPAGLATYTDGGDLILSPGQQARIKAASVLLAPPPLVVLDRVLEKCDPRSRRLVWEALSREAGQRHMTLVVLSTERRPPEDVNYEIVL